MQREMSKYLQGIDPVSKKRYLQCLQALGLTEEDDPYLETKLQRLFSV